MFDPGLYLETIIETMQDGLMVVDTEGEIISVNHTMEELTGFKRKELIGSPCSILNCDICFQMRAAGKERYCRLFVEGKIRRQKCEMRKKDGSPLNVLKNAALLKGKNGEILGGVETLTDLSDVVARDQVISSLRQEIGIEHEFHGLLGSSLPMRQLFALIKSAADSEAPVMILGESGTGKELVAKAIHRLGPRADRPFLTVNCAALNDALLESELFGHVKGAFTGADRSRTGRFEASHGGDFFLDEIGDMPLSTQVKLLRVLEEKVVERVGDYKPIPINIRIICATNMDLKKRMQQGLFREDLYYRIGVIPIHLPALRDRRMDIPLLIDAFVKRIAIRSGKNISGFSKEALDLLMNYPWPGNVRELINAIEYAFVLTHKGEILPRHLPPELATGIGQASRSPRRMTAAMEEKERLLEALEQAGGRKIEAAQHLKVSRVTLWKRMKKHGIQIENRVR